jgi:hypothetical protein
MAASSTQGRRRAKAIVPRVVCFISAADSLLFLSRLRGDVVHRAVFQTWIRIAQNGYVMKMNTAVSMIAVRISNSYIARTWYLNDHAPVILDVGREHETVVPPRCKLHWKQKSNSLTREYLNKIISPMQPVESRHLLPLRCPGNGDVSCKQPTAKCWGWRNL